MPIVVPQIDATIPDGITDLESFRRWARSDEFPEKGRFAFLNGYVWMEVTMEMAFSHNQVKTEFCAKLATLVKERQLGRFFSDGMLLTNLDAGFSTMPDGLFGSFRSFEKDLIRGFGTDEHDFVELVGSPDMVLEVVSKSSVEKDTVDLVDQYWRAEIQEYWLVDARGKQLRFDILSRGDKGYAAASPSSDGWTMSDVFGRAFRLVRSTDQLGDPSSLGIASKSAWNPVKMCDFGGAIQM